MAERQPVVITISRQMASGGAYIGHLLARKLGWQYVEREVLHQAAKRLGVDIAALSAVEERRTSFIENLIKGFAFGTPEAAYIPPSRRPVYDQELFKTEANIMKEIAGRYDSVIVGRAGYFVLQGRPGVINVFIHAPIEFRIRRIQTFHHVTAEQARKELEDSDRIRERFLKSTTGTDWNDARNYHLCVDSAAAGFEAAQQMIDELVEKKKQEMGA